MSNENSSAASNECSTLSSGRGGIIGVKAGMTQVFTPQGEALAVTIVQIKPNQVTAVKTPEKDGYSAVQVGLGAKKPGRAGKSELGRLKKIPNATGFSHYQELRVSGPEAVAGLEAGTLLDASFLKEGDLVDVSSVSKGKGFQGVMKRYHFSGGFATHGASVNHRSAGSIGNRADPAKVFKGKKMAGHMGHRKVTLQNIRVVKVDSEKGFVLLFGSVPGPKSGLVTLRKAVKVSS